MFNSPRPRALLLVLAIATLGTASVPAFAKDDNAGAKGSTQMTVQHRNGKTLYCVNDPATTGTRLPTQLCQNREEWARQGLVIPEQQQRASDNSSSAKDHPEG